MFKPFWHICKACVALALILASMSCDIPPLPAGDDAPEVAVEVPPPPAGAWIDAPLSGAVAPPGTTIKVIGHVDPSVGQAVLYFNGGNSGLPSAPILNKQPPAYEWMWTPQQPGIYNLQVGGVDGPLSNVVRVTITGEMTFSADFWADQTSLRPGECTSLHWVTENTLSVHLQGQEVEPQGDMGVCPEQNETHVLQVQYLDNSGDELTVSLTIIEDTPTHTNTPTHTHTPTPTITQTPTSTPTRYVPATTTVPPPVITTTSPPPVITTTVPPPSDTTPPGAPSGLSPCGTSSAPSFVSASPATLSWSSVRDASGIAQYKITLTNRTTKQTNEYFTTSTSYSVTVQDASYVWRVTAQDGVGNWGTPSQQCFFYHTIIK
jgi:hypothetical protein